MPERRLQGCIHAVRDNLGFIPQVRFRDLNVFFKALAKTNYIDYIR